MQIILHAGAHFTEEDRLFKTLLRNKEPFAQRGVAIPAPGRYRPLVREMLGALESAEPSPDARDVLVDAILDDETADRVILNHVHVFGAPLACLRSGMLYDLAPERMHNLMHLFEHDQIELFLAIKNPAVFLPGLFSASPQNTMESFLRGDDPLSIRWSTTLREIRSAAPGVTITTWCYEDMPLLWAQIIREMAGLEHGEKITGGFDLLSEIMTNEGMQRFRSYLKTHPKMSELQKRRVIAAFLDKFAIEDAIEEEIEAPGWDEDLLDDLTRIYEEDIQLCAQIPGVNFMMP